MERDPLNDYLNVVSNILTQISSTQRENLLNFGHLSHMHKK